MVRSSRRGSAFLYFSRVFIAQAISYNCVSETENERDFQTAESNGQNRIDDPCSETRIYRLLFLNKVLAKNNQQRRSLDHVHTRTSQLHQSISAHTQMKLCSWGEGKHAVCASREEGCLPPRSRRSRASTTCRRRWLSSFSANTSSVRLLCLANAAITTARRVARRS